MPRKAKVQQPAPVVEAPPIQQPIEEQATTVSKEDYNKARAMIKQYRETKKQQPKRQCSERQLEALAQGRMKNKRFAKKQETK